MREYTITDIIRVLPFSKEDREKLLADYPTYDDALQFEVKRICWEQFAVYLRTLSDLKEKTFLAEVQQGSRKLSSSFSDDAKKAVLDEFEDVLTGKKEELEQIDTIRTKLQELIASRIH